MSESSPIPSTGHDALATAPVHASAAQKSGDEYTWGGYMLFLAQRVFVYFVLYALSIGPLYWKWYESQFVGGSGILAAFYIPLVFLANGIPAFGAWMDWYIRLWVG